MLGFGKNMGILLLSVTVILSAATFLTTQTLDRSSTNDVGFLMGHVTITVVDENGYVKDYRQSDNVIVEHGWEALVQNGFSITPFTGAIVAPTGGSAFSHIGIGSGGADPLSGLNEDITTPIVACPRSVLEAFSDGAGTDPMLGSTIITFELSADFFGDDCAGDGSDIDEAGVFNTDGVSPGGEMFARNAFAPVTALGPDDSLLIDWDFTFIGAAPEVPAP